MRDFQQVILLGNLTRDPELRYTPGGQPVSSVSVATNRSWVDGTGERKDAVEYHDIVIWGKMAELSSQFLTKGRKVLVVGRLQTRSWEAQDGSKRQKTEIVATDINFVDRPKEGGPQTTKEVDKKIAEAVTEEEINIDDIPF
ncbi:MAG: Single-stranded DNA-binding protein [candidate division CPR2 bacterium GW2011_GWC1_39_9]|uniref:Single-stranded DNA-binding protein n=1 Tax=candidate division CPR2 bacterium GW2011_GWC2_39_10 TaxID=1618345 RepID=A0A0G0LTD2_UNCC2|nr:MAG: Single-stranded DNA-binding protein [candidate division CPR2 bacterium GW2011_GWC2_39_10]KKR33605.1 MAG: Single-stranded DNA-binding protein [candidate division CPR2 bacterium GW2011_GWC1_39_9]